MDLRDIKEFFKDAFKYIITIVIVLVIVIYGFTFQQIVGSSMYPTYKNEEIVILKKYYYKIFDIKRFDVVSLRYNDTKYLIKRVIGLPGDKIEYINNVLYVNGSIVEEEFLNEEVVTKDFKLEELGYMVIPEDMYFVLGDNRSDSLDSMDFGLVKKEDIIGKVNLRVWPLNKIKYIK